MDPDATIEEMRRISKEDQSEFHDDIHRLCELFLALDEWMAKGGMPPHDWSHRFGHGQGECAVNETC